MPGLGGADITGIDTSTFGIQSGTAFWKMQNIEDRIGIFKSSYISVGARHMPTQADESGARKSGMRRMNMGQPGRPRRYFIPGSPASSYKSACRASK